MDYSRIYNDLITNAKSRPTLEGYKERHHIIPKCIGGSNNNDNLVDLTAREHFLAHWLLYKIHNNQKMAHAFHMMTVCGKGQKRYYSRLYEYAKKAKSKHQSEMMNEWYKHNTHPNKGIKHSQDRKDQISRSCSKALTQRAKNVYQYDLEGNFLAEFNSAKLAKNSIDPNLPSALPNIIKYCNLERGKYKNFQWRWFKADKIEPFSPIKRYWYSNLDTEEEIQILEGKEIPDGFVKGRKFLKTRNNKND